MEILHYGYYLHFPNGGIPYGLSNKYLFSLIMSHEILEMLGNPRLNLKTATIKSDSILYIWSHEVADPVQSPLCGYIIDGILVSDFVYPSWFDVDQYGMDVRFDKTGMLDEPYTIAVMGYAPRLRVELGKSFPTVDDVIFQPIPRWVGGI